MTYKTPQSRHTKGAADATGDIECPATRLGFLRIRNFIWAASNACSATDLRSLERRLLSE